MRKLIAVLLFVAALGCTSIVNAARPGGGAKAPSYTGRNLGVLPGHSYSFGNGVSDAGSVVGTSGYSTNESTVIHPFYWDRATGVMMQLPTSGATSEGTGHAFAVAGKTKASEYAVGVEDAPGTFVHAVIWLAPSLQTPPIVLDSGETAASTAWGVNDDGTAVGSWGDETAIWAHDGSGNYTMTTIDIFENQPEDARDINNQGIVVGYGYDLSYTQTNAFLLAEGVAHALPPGGTDLYARALAVGDVFATPAGDEFVFVSGSTTAADGTAHAVRWTVKTGTWEVTETKVLAKEWSSGVNTSGDVACTNDTSARQSATLWRNDVFISLKPPKGMTDAASLGLARTALSPTYVVGTASSSASTRAVIWEVR